jgi:hypothetical protein
MEPAERTVVRLLMSSGAIRIIDAADSARLEDAFFVITRCDSLTGRVYVVLTLRSEDVIGAEILTNGVRTAYVAGKGANK